jgi:GntR family transcriptional regulator
MKMAIYKRILEDLKQRIVSDEYRLGSLLPTEQKLQEAYSTSRTTIRNAIKILETEGLVSRQQGRGTILISRPTTQRLNNISSFSETLREKGLRAETGLLTVRMGKPNPLAAKRLEVPEDRLIYTIQRTKLVDGKVIGFLNNRILSDIVPDLDTHTEYLREHGLYETLESIYGLELLSAIETISVHMSSHFENDVFEVNEPIPLFHIERITKLKDGRIFEYVTTHVRTEYFEYRVVLNSRKNKQQALE